MLTTFNQSDILPDVRFGGASQDGISANGVAKASLSRDDVVQQLAKVLVSETFIRSKRLGQFLRFTVEQTLAGRQGTLKEYLVGVEVFNKQETFDPRIDSIVRVEARRLRSKIATYYATEGLDDRTMIQFRKGSYVPLIGTREQMESLCPRNSDSATRRRRSSVAIARFTNVTSEPAYDNFCAGLTQDLITGLTKIPSLCLLATSNGGAQVKPDFLLEGSIRKQRNRVRISAQLIDNSTHSYVWSESYERDISDAFAVQDEISQSIQTAIRLVS